MPVNIAGFIVAFGPPYRLLNFAGSREEGVAIAGVADEDWPETGYVMLQLPGERLHQFASAADLRDTLCVWASAPPRVADRTPASDQSRRPEVHTAHP